MNIHKVAIEVVQVWWNAGSYAPYTIEKQDEWSVPQYCIKIGDDLFPIGMKGTGIYLSDYVISKGEIE